MEKKDLRNTPFCVMVVLGESTVAGRMASEELFQWPRVVADQISELQDEPVKLFNEGIGANVISTCSPGYDVSGKPSALERFEEDVIRLNPDLVILAYGLNDMRCATPIEQFRSDYQEIISKTKEKTKALIVLISVYHMTAYSEYGPHWNHGNVEQTQIYNLAIKQLAEKNECLYVDVYESEGAADWLIHPDGVHANDLGHRLIGNRVFESIAKNCSGLSQKTYRIIEERKHSWDWAQYPDYRRRGLKKILTEIKDA